MAGRSVFDEQGSDSLFFLLTALVFYLIPATYFKFFSSNGSFTDPEDTNPKFIQLSKKKKAPLQTKKSGFSFGSLIYILVWIAFFCTLYKIHENNANELPDAQKFFDPYEILGIPIGSTEGEIKKSYRKLSRTYHPDKNPDDPAANEKFVKVTKAYQTLTDVAARENWEMYGHPDGQQATESYFAMPQWIVDESNRPIVLGCYFLAFMVFLPAFVAGKSQTGGNYTANQKILKQSAMAFFELYSSILSSQKDFPVQSFIEMLSASVEFLEIAPMRDSERAELQKLRDRLPAFEVRERVDQDYCTKARILILAHLNRVELSSHLKTEQSLILSKALDLVAFGIVPLLSAKGSKPGTLAAMQFHYMLVQAVWEGSPPLSMLPHMKPSFFESPDAPAPPTLPCFVGMKRSAKRKWLSDLSDDQFEDAVIIAENSPAVLVDISLGGANTGIAVRSMVTLTIQMERVTLKKNLERQAEIKALRDSGQDVSTKYSPGGIKYEVPEKKNSTNKSYSDDFDDEEWEELKKSNPKKKSVDESSPSVYCPFYCLPKNESWWVIISNAADGQFVVAPKRVDNLVTSVSFDMMFQAPQKPGQYKYIVNIQSDSYYVVYQQYLQFKVFPQQEQPKIQEVEEEYSEEEEVESTDEESGLDSDSE